MNFLKYIIILCGCFLTSVSFGQWHEPKAKFRLEVVSEMPEEYGYVDFSRICLPVQLKNGVAVFDESGQRIPSSLDLEKRGITFASDAKNKKSYIYWGFDTLQPPDHEAEKIGAVPVRTPLELTVVPCGIQNVSLEEWIDAKQSNIIRWNDRSIRSAWERIPISKEEFDSAEKEFGPKRDEAAAKSRRAKAQITRINRKINQEKKKLSDASRKLRNIKRQRNAKELRTQYQKDILAAQKKIRELYRSTKKYYNQIRSYDKQYRQLKHKVDRTRWRYDWSQKNLVTTEERKTKALKDLMVEAKEKNGRELEFLKYFATDRKIRKIGSCLPEKIYLTNMPFGYRSGFAARFAGNLVIEQPGEYEFAVDSTSNILLYIDDELVINWYGDRDPNHDWSKKCKVKLDRGLHDYKMYYKRAQRSQEAYVLAAWKKPGDKDFQVLTEDVFAPGYRVKFVALSDREGHEYPVIKIDKHISIFSGKKERLLWVNCENVLGGDVEWFIAGKKVAEGNATALFFKDGESREVVVKQKNSPEIKVELPEYETGWKVHTAAKLDFKFWLPQFIYDDENLDMYMEMASGLPAPIKCNLKVTASNPENPFIRLAKAYKIPGAPEDPREKYAPLSALKFTVPLNGADLKNGLDATFTLEAGGINFAEAKLRFINIAECPDLKTGYEGLTDADGAIVIPVLHRPTLGDLRRWQLPGIVMNSFVDPQKVLVIADDYGSGENGFFAVLKNKYSEQGITAECLPWRHKAAAADSLADFVKPIRETDAQAAIIIPPVLDPISTPRQTRRTLSAVIQLLKNNPNVKKIRVATPYPSLKSARNQLISDVKKLAREHGVGIIYLNRYVSGLNLPSKLGSQTESSYFPDRNANSIADFICDDDW